MQLCALPVAIKEANAMLDLFYGLLFLVIAEGIDPTVAPNHGLMIISEG